MAAGLTFGTVLADAGYGLSAPFRQGLSARADLGGRDPRSPEGLPGGCRAHLARLVAVGPARTHSPTPLSRPAEAMLAEADWKKLSWRTGTKGALKAGFAAVRVRVADGPPQRILDKGQQHMPGEEAWLVGEGAHAASANTISPTCRPTPTSQRSPPPSRPDGCASKRTSR